MEQAINEEQKELLKLIEECEKKGYSVFSNINEINELIDIIIRWYEFKYPDFKIKLYTEDPKDSFRICPSDTNIMKLDNLGNNMCYTELMFRLPEKFHTIIECWYQNKTLENKQENLITTHINEKNTLVPVQHDITFDKHDGYFDNMSKKWILDKLNINCNTINELIYKLNNGKIEEKISANLDFDDLEKLVITHKINLKIREKIFNLIALKLFESAKNNIIGYVKVKLFIIEFNKYLYNLDLNIPSYIMSQMTNDELEYNKIIYDLYADKIDSIENYGITFDGIKSLKRKGIFNIECIPKQYHISILYDGVFNEYMCQRDQMICDQIIKKLDEDFSDKLHSKLYEQIENRNIVKEQKPEKKKLLKKIFSK